MPPSTSTVSPPARSLAAFPAGSNGEFDLPPELAIVIERGRGCELWDTGGRRFLDFSMGWGSALVGHGREEVLTAVSQQLPRGANFAYVTDQSLRLAERLIQISPTCQAVRFCASGTEATMYCLRLARAATGRRKILKFEGAYHGAHEVGVISLSPSAAGLTPRGDMSCTGSAAFARDDILVAPFNDAAAVRTLVRQHAADLAAVIIEPLQRCLPPRPGFLDEVRRVTADHGVLLVFDEVVTGFRLALGGAQEYYGVTPDLVAYGKALGGGFPIGAYGASPAIMDFANERRMRRGGPYAWTASSTGGNPVSASAALATLGVLNGPGVYERLHALGKYLRAAMRAVLSRRGITAQVIGDGPLAQVVFTDRDVRDYWSSRHRDPDLGRQLMLGLFRRGIFLNPMGTKLYLSLAHDERVCDEFCEILSDTLADLV